MKLVDDWRDVVSHSFSWWTMFAGIVAMIIPEALYGIWRWDTNPYFWWWTGMLLLVAGMAGRLVEQPLPKWRERLRVGAMILLALVIAAILVGKVYAAPATEQQTLAIAVPFTGRQEGLRLTAYKPFAWDRWTICYGETHGVTPGMTRTKAQCDALLRDRLIVERNALHRYFTTTTIDARLPPTRDAAYLDVAHNCGADAIGRSTATRRLNGGDIAGGCEALTWWNRGGGRVLRGLVIRRRKNQAMCMIGTSG